MTHVRNFQYYCRDCGYEFEANPSKSGSGVVMCPKCQSFNVVKKFGSFNFDFSKKLKAMDNRE
jgi:putative FmdB family regulatory protein